jgi:hypothetical protein
MGAPDGRSVNDNNVTNISKGQFVGGVSIFFGKTLFHFLNLSSPSILMHIAP